MTLTKLYEHRKAKQKVFEEIKQPVIVYGGGRRYGKIYAIRLFGQRRKEQTAQ